MTPLVIYDFDPRKLPPAYLQAIGLTIAAASQTESVLKDLIGALLEIDSVQTIALTIPMSFPVKNDIIRTLAELEAPSIKELDKIDDLLDAVNEAIAMRNIIAHRQFAIHPDNKEIYILREKAKGSLQYELKPITLEEIQRDAEKIYKAGMDIIEFMMRAGLKTPLRTKALRGPVNRGKKAREDRRSKKP